MVDAEMRKLMDAIDAFLEKKGAATEGKFHITKLLSEEYWGEMIEDNEPEDDEDEDFEVAESEPEAEELEEIEPEESEGDVDEDFEDEVEDLQEVPDKIPPLEIPRPTSKAHAADMKKKLLNRAGKMKKPKLKIR